MYELTGAVYNGVAVLEHVTTLMRGSRACWPPTASLPRKLIDIDTFAERASVECGPDPSVDNGPRCRSLGQKTLPAIPVDAQIGVSQEKSEAFAAKRRSRHTELPQIGAVALAHQLAVEGQHLVDQLRAPRRRCPVAHGPSPVT